MKQGSNKVVIKLGGKSEHSKLVDNKVVIEVGGKTDPLFIMTIHF